MSERFIPLRRLLTHTIDDSQVIDFTCDLKNYRSENQGGGYAHNLLITSLTTCEEQCFQREFNEAQN